MNQHDVNSLLKRPEPNDELTRRAYQLIERWLEWARAHGHTEHAAGLVYDSKDLIANAHADGSAVADLEEEVRIHKQNHACCKAWADKARQQRDDAMEAGLDMLDVLTVKAAGGVYAPSEETVNRWRNACTATTSASSLDIATIMDIAEKMAGVMEPLPHWRLCDDPDCVECQGLIESGLIWYCDECHEICNGDPISPDQKRQLCGSCADLEQNAELSFQKGAKRDE